MRHFILSAAIGVSGGILALAASGGIAPVQAAPILPPSCVPSPTNSCIPPSAGFGVGLNFNGEAAFGVTDWYPSANPSSAGPAGLNYSGEATGPQNAP